MFYKIKTIDVLSDVNELNKLNYDIEILYIKKLKINIENGKENIESLFRHIRLPVMLKHIFIDSIMPAYIVSPYWTFEKYLLNKEKFLKMFKSLSLPFNCKLDAIIDYKNNRGLNIFFYFYSSDEPNELTYYKNEHTYYKNEHNNDPFQEAYFKYLDKNIYNKAGI